MHPPKSAADLNSPLHKNQLIFETRSKSGKTNNNNSYYYSSPSSNNHHHNKHTNNNVNDAAKFEKFEILKERFKRYRQKVLRVGYENLLKTHPGLTLQFAQSCTNLNIDFTDFMNDQQIQHSPFCSCHFCHFCAQQQQILSKIAYLNYLEQDIKEIRDCLRDTRKKLEQKEQKSRVANDWKQVALVLDRTFFYVYLIITFFAIFMLFPSDQLLDESTMNKRFKFMNSLNNYTTSTPATTETTTSSSSIIKQFKFSSSSISSNFTETSSLFYAMSRAVRSVASDTLAFKNRHNEQNTNGFLFF
jgi:hypothetical protein